MKNNYCLLAKKSAERFNVDFVEIDLEGFLDLECFEDALYHIKTEWAPVDILIINGPKVDGKYLLSFNGALSERARKEKFIPNFTGVNIAKEVGVGLVAINDPITYFDDDIYIGWYLGGRGSNFQTNLLSLIQHLSLSIDAKFCAFGGSGGGFASLSFLERSNDIVEAYVWNCQTVINRYYPRFWKYYSKVAFNIDNPSQEQFDRELERELISASLVRPGVLKDEKSFLYLQNGLDWHLENHAIPFVNLNFNNYENDNGFYSNGNKYFFQGGWGIGHAVPPKELIVNTLFSYLNGNVKQLETQLQKYLYLSGESKIKKSFTSPDFDISNDGGKIVVAINDDFASSAAIYRKKNNKVIEKYSYRETKVFHLDMPVSFVGTSYVIFVKYSDESVKWREVGDFEIVNKLNKNSEEFFECCLKNNTLEVSVGFVKNESELCYCLIKNGSIECSTGYSNQKTVVFNLLESCNYSVVVFKRNEDFVTFSKGGAVSEDRTRKLVELKSQYSTIISKGYEQLKSNGYMMRKDISPIKINNKMSWRHEDRNGEFSLHTLRFLEPIWGKFFETTDQIFINESVGLLRSWYDSFSNEKSRFYWYDMAVGIRAVHISLLLDLSKLYPIKDSDVVFFKKVANEHIQKLVNPKNLGHGNHAIYQLIGLKYLLLATGNNVNSYYEYCHNKLGELISTLFDENSVNVENSPFYHGYNLGLISKIPRRIFPELEAQIRTIVNKAAMVKKWLSNAAGAYYIIGDTEGKGSSLELPSYTYDFVGSQKKYVSKDYSSSGYQVIRTHPEVPRDEFSALVFHATNKSKIHSHCDHLSFILYLNGVELITDSGKYTYEDNCWRKFFLSDRAHNTFGLSNQLFFPDDVELEKTKQLPMKVDAAEKMYVLSASTQRSGVYLEREIIFKPDYGVDIHDFIDCKSEAGHKEIRYHLGVGSEVEEESGTYYIVNKGRKLCSIEFSENPLSVNVYTGSENDSLGWVSYEYNVRLARPSLIATFDASVVKLSTFMKWI
ncbi:heparinase II/III family protein [Vreelandella titanicae]|uniref:heparinase II/III domain-containing protein n=1 Tax=Vreelandella titanicae TaxID=664683 RepID=UPI00315817F9